MMIGTSLSPFLPPGAGLGAAVRVNPADAANPGEPAVSAGLNQSATTHRAEEPSRPEDGAQSGDDDSSRNGKTEDGAGNQHSESELLELSRLKARDREVRAHETAHQATGGQYASAPTYEYERGPDGVQYAVGGEVQIDIAPVEWNPQATIEKMRVVRAAALAPAEPSGQDRAVAAEATQIMLRAQVDLAQEARDLRSAQAGGDERRGNAAVTAYNSIADSGPEIAAQDSPGFQATA